MRIEQMAREDIERSLQRLHRRINDHVFFGVLEDIPVYLCDTLRGSSKDPGKIFIDVSKDENKDLDIAVRGAFINEPENLFIAISYELVLDYSDTFFSKQNQVSAMCQVLLHEMVHQYCYKHNIDDTDHGDTWTATAERFHLISEYSHGKMRFENIDWPYREYIEKHYRI